MQTDQRNYRVVGGEGQAAMSTQDERTWSILTHLSMFLNLFTGFLGPVAALVIWLIYKDRSQKVAFHALQSMWYQVGWLVILAVQSGWPEGSTVSWWTQPAPPRLPSPLSSSPSTP